MRKHLWWVLLACLLLLSGCTSEQTIVRKVNEPLALSDIETLKVLEQTWSGGMVLDAAPDNQSALLWENGQVSAVRSGNTKAIELSVPAEELPGASRHIVWSPNSRYACWQMAHDCVVIDLEKQETVSIGAVGSACFNADQITLYYTKGTALYRQKLFSGEAEQLMDTEGTCYGPMFRTTRNQYLVMRGDQKLVCLEQSEKTRQWGVRIVADFQQSGMADCDFSYSAQTGLCIVSGDTAYGSQSFSVVSPDGEGFVIDQVSVFSPLDQTAPCRNLSASELHALEDAASYPAALRHVQLSPGGLYLLLWGEDRASGANLLYLLNLDKGKLTEVTLDDAWRMEHHAAIDWCCGKTLLLADPAGNTAVCTVTGWDD